MLQFQLIELAGSERVDTGADSRPLLLFPVPRSLKQGVITLDYFLATIRRGGGGRLEGTNGSDFTWNYIVVCILCATVRYFEFLGGCTCVHIWVGNKRRGAPCGHETANPAVLTRSLL